jgi:hypothetical protein
MYLEAALEEMGLFEGDTTCPLRGKRGKKTSQCGDCFLIRQCLADGSQQTARRLSASPGCHIENTGVRSVFTVTVVPSECQVWQGGAHLPYGDSWSQPRLKGEDANLFGD